MQVTQNVLTSPAVAVLRDLEHAGLDLAVVDGRLRVWPVERLTAEHELLIRQHRNELVTLVRICDGATQERMVVFKQQFTDAPATQIPAFLFRLDLPYVKGACFSCGAALLEIRYGRYLLCSLAWRLAAGVGIPAELAAAVDEARVA